MFLVLNKIADSRERDDNNDGLTWNLRDLKSELKGYLW